MTKKKVAVPAPVTARPLFAISDDLRIAAHIVIAEAMENDGIVDDEAALERLDALSGEMAENLDGLWEIHQECMDDAARTLAESDRLRARATSTAIAGTRLRDLVEKCLRHSGTEKLASERREFALVGSPPVLEIDDETLVPDEYRKGELKLTGTLAAITAIRTFLARAKQDPDNLGQPDIQGISEDTRLMVSLPEVATSVDKAGIKKQLKQMTDGRGNRVGDVPGTTLVESRKRLRVK